MTIDPATCLYLRCSTTHQDNKIQLRDLFAWLAANKLTRHGVRWFRDRGESSDAHSRPAWNRMMAAIRAGEIKRLVTWKVDRCNRFDVRDHLRWRLELDALGVELVSLTEPDAGRFLTDFDLIRDVFESGMRAKWLRDHRERVTRGVREGIRKRGGKWGFALQPGHQRISAADWTAILAERAAGARWSDLSVKWGVRADYLSRRARGFARVLEDAKVIA